MQVLYGRQQTGFTDDNRERTCTARWRTESDLSAPSTSTTSAFALAEEEVGALTSCCLQKRWAGGRGGGGGGGGAAPASLSQNPLRVIQTAEKGRKCDPGLITAGAAISENSERRADKEVSVLFPVGCFVRCERLNVSLCVEANCLCSEVATPSQRHTKERPTRAERRL